MNKEMRAWNLELQECLKCSTEEFYPDAACNDAEELGDGCVAPDARIQMEAGEYDDHKDKVYRQTVRDVC